MKPRQSLQLGGASSDGEGTQEFTSELTFSQLRSFFQTKRLGRGRLIFNRSLTSPPAGEVTILKTAGANRYTRGAASSRSSPSSATSTRATEPHTELVHHCRIHPRGRRPHREIPVEAGEGAREPPCLSAPAGHHDVESAGAPRHRPAQARKSKPAFLHPHEDEGRLIRAGRAVERQGHGMSCSVSSTRTPAATLPTQ